MIVRILLLVIAYLLGSIPVGYLIVRRRVDEDIRDSGSGGTGATNVLRKAGKSAAVVTLLLDALKGALAVVLMKQVAGSDQWWIGAAAVAAVVGHVFTIWLGFRGGKGVATGAGVFLVLSPVSVLLSIPVFVALVYFRRYVSLGSIVATAAIPLWIFVYEVLILRQPPETTVALET